ncbi:membrane alanyl aminopeptidase-like [Ostrinia furnacalis]|uniref:membrane alanyl aminopeptidase-like n=1 Tax=Ostrinia furnacalis TaxID=93504 RepID=UPI00103D67BD|nr:membrane alanyl aminopeptidase-like [Ostrinia furnacalis]
MFRLVIVAACLLICSNASDPNYRLNTTIKPSKYAISIMPFFDTGDERAFTFNGDVTITFTSDEPINQIKLHSQDLTFSSDNITIGNSAGAVPLNETNALEFDSAYTFAHINLQGALQAGVEYTLRILYEGPIREDLTGFYRNNYIEKGVKKWLGATQMEPTHARKVFPCFDEPELKAVFTLTIMRPASYKPSLTNTKIAATTDLSNGYVREDFHPTPRMSTYLVAFLVSELEAQYYSSNNSMEFGVFARPEATNQTEYAFDFGKRVVDALGDYFGVNYYSTNNQLKLDHIALPNFRAGAMENWGLVKYREALLLYVPEESGPYYKYRVAQIVAHETTHMWFGNLVTCHWWSNTWLNEGFANYFQDYITALIEPEVGSGNILVTGSVYAALDADESPSSPPITNDNVSSPAEISEHFGTITYQKAGSVIRMMHHLIGDEAFRIGLNSYLTTNQFQAGYPELMYSALEKGVNTTNSLALYPGHTIGDIMSSWISQAGHPVLDVQVNYEAGSVTLTQRRFYINGSHTSDETYKIPITYTTGDNPNFVNTKPAFIMEGKTHTFNIHNFTQTWIIFNLQETGLYRVKYDSQSLQMIIKALKGGELEKIHYLNRAKIINDLFAFYFADEVSFSTLNDALLYLQSETDFNVWYAAIRGLNKLRSRYLGTDTVADIIDAHTLHLLHNTIAYLGFEERESDDFETIRNRMQVLELACKLDHTECVEHFVAKFRNFVDNGVVIPPSLRPVAYCTGLRYGTGADYDFMWQRMSTTNVANEARLIGEVLGCTTDEASLKKFLVSMLEENSPIMSQDLTVPLSGVVGNHSHVHIVIDGLKNNFTLWSSIYPSMDTVFNAVAGALRTEAEINEFESWLNSCTECGDKDGALATLASGRANAMWVESHKTELLNAFKGHAVALPSSLALIVLCLAVLRLN